MIICIIAGGSGTRLWPLSQPDYPKHLLRLTGEQSLLQNTYDRVLESTDQIYVITEASHADAVRLQLPGLDPDRVLVEPGRRGTASCIAYALAVIGVDHHNETVGFLAADHHIADTAGFGATVSAAGQASESERLITLIGLQPTYPATGFGYIQSGDLVATIDGIPVKKAHRFVEKPAYDLAKSYIADGNYLWNLSLFIAPHEVFVDTMNRYSPVLYAGYESLVSSVGRPEFRQAYLDLPTDSIDYALMEHVPDLLVVPGQFDWADVGSFTDLHAILRGMDGNAMAGEVYQVDCEDSMIHASDKPIVAIGLSGIVVIDTPEGLLVCSKEQSQKVGDMAKLLAAKRQK
jgi:mannose-1-phosphate guanylyltransferase